MDHHEESDFQWKADHILDKPAHEDGAGGLIVVEGKPEGIEPQMYEEGHQYEGDAHRGKGDFLFMEKISIYETGKEIGEKESGKEHACPQTGASYEITKSSHQSPFPRPVPGACQCNGKESEGDADEGCLNGKYIGKKDGKAGQDAQYCHFFCFHHIPPFPEMEYHPYPFCKKKTPVKGVSLLS